MAAGTRIDGLYVGALGFSFVWVFTLLAGIAQRYIGSMTIAGSVKRIFLWSLIAGVVGGLGANLSPGNTIENSFAVGVLVGMVVILGAGCLVGIRRLYELARSKVEASST